MHWFEALQIYLNSRTRQQGKVLSATVETTQAPRKLRGKVVGGWLFEERRTPRGNIALHLFPSVD